MIRYYPLKDINLLPSDPFYEDQQNMNAFLLSQDPDTLLYNFRKACGLDTKGAQPMTGWDAPEGKLRGHTTGHFLSALALACTAAKEEKAKQVLDYLVDELQKCQEAFASSQKTAPGFLSAYDEEQFDLLEIFTPYPEIWAPYYTLDKIMSGLLDAYEYTGNPKAFTIADRMGDWTWNRLSRVPDETRTKMWSMYIAGEYGGMIGTMLRLYKHSRKENHRKCASLFYNKKLFDPMLCGEDCLPEMHANQHIPQIIGAMWLYETTKDEKWYRIAENFYSIVTESHAYCIGGVGEKEKFHKAQELENYLTMDTAESCASINMLRLCAMLFPYSAEKSMMDYYENTLFNHIAASFCRDRSGGTTYFLPLCPDGYKEFTTDENTCCHGTGLESRYRFQEHIYAWDEENLYVNLWLCSKLDSKEDGLQVLRIGDGLFEIRLNKVLKRNLCLRIPDYAEKTDPGNLIREEEIKQRILKEQEEKKDKKGYLVIEGPLPEGTLFHIAFPWKERLEAGKRHPSMKYIKRGPYIMARLLDGTEIPISQVQAEHYQIYVH